VTPMPAITLPNPVRPTFRADTGGDVIVNIGPSHPATHGTIQVIAALDGEKVRRVDVHCGYLHRGFEKECESHTWTNLIPYVDRLNYCSGLINDFAYCEAVEALMDIEITPRCRYLRTLLSEYSRIADHLTCMSAGAMELGAMTIYFWGIKAREWIWEMLEELSGARMTHSYVRVGGLAYDLTPDFIPKVKALFPKINVVLKDIQDSLYENRIFRDRMDGTGVITQERALSYGWTGPALRSTGVDYDVRKAHPYLVYDRFDFDIPVGSKGDNFDRYIVRMEEARQSMRILEQAFAQIPEGPVCIDDPRIILPPKPAV